MDVAAGVELVIAAAKGIRLRPETAGAVTTQLCDLVPAPQPGGA